MPLPDDARFVLLAAQVLRQAGWHGDPFLAVQRQYPTWTHARWGQAQDALSQWQRQQAQGRGQDNGMEALGATPWEERETDEDT